MARVELQPRASDLERPAIFDKYLYVVQSQHQVFIRRLRIMTMLFYYILSPAVEEPFAHSGTSEIRLNMPIHIQAFLLGDDIAFPRDILHAHHTGPLEYLGPNSAVKISCRKLG